MAKIKIDTKRTTREEWVEIRKSSIGGSDASTIMGANRWASLFTLYADKKGLTTDKETSVAMAVGTHCEELVAKMFADETGQRVRNDFMMYEHDQYPFITANLDRRIIGENAGLECKTTQAYTLADFADGSVPPTYFWQCMHYMAVMGFDRMYLACILSNRHFVWREIPRDDELIDRLITAEVIFWEEYVEPGIEPEADGSDATGDALKEIYPENEGEPIDIEIDDLVTDYLVAITAEKEAKRCKDHAMQRIQQMMGSAPIAFGSHTKATWKTYQTSRFDSKRFERDHPDLFAEYRTTSTAKKFTAKETGGNV